MPTGTDAFELLVPAVGCRHTTRALTAAVRDVVGVRTVEVRAGDVLRITGSVDPEAVIAHLRRAGYDPRRVS